MAVKIVLSDSTAVAAIPVAATVVVIIVTFVVTLPSENVALFIAHSFRLVQTLTGVAIFERVLFRFLVRFDATVATVPVAAAIVITIVTDSITFEGQDCTFW